MREDREQGTASRCKPAGVGLNLREFPARRCSCNAGGRARRYSRAYARGLAAAASLDSTILGSRIVNVGAVAGLALDRDVAAHHPGETQEPNIRLAETCLRADVFTHPVVAQTGAIRSQSMLLRLVGSVDFAMRRHPSRHIRVVCIDKALRAVFRGRHNNC